MKEYPFNGDAVITQYFRRDKYSSHLGIDYALGHRTAIIAVTDGVVETLRSDEKRNWLANSENDPYKPVGFPVIKRSLKTEDYGNYIKLNHGDDISTLYAHLDEVLVYEGQYVKEGELIAYSDNTGNSTGNHLHFELRKSNYCIDPIDFYRKYPDYKGKGGEKEESDNFYPYSTTVQVNENVDTLYVRSGPAKIYALSGSKTLKAKDSIPVMGFVKGERIIYGNISTQFWWKSAKGNYFWAGATSLIPTLDNFPEGMLKKDINFNLKEELIMEEKLKLIEDLKSREKEIIEVIDAKNKELSDVREEILKTEDEVNSIEEAPVEEPVIEETVETLVEEVTQVEETESVQEEGISETEKEEILSFMAKLKEKFGL